MKKGKATRPGTCSVCSQPYVKGERVVYKAAVHEGCFSGGFSTIPPAPTLEYVRLRALNELEEAIKVAAQVNGVDDAIEKLWERYEKLKVAGLRAGSTQEERTALRHALLDAVRMAF